MSAKYRVSEDDYVNAMALFGKITWAITATLLGLALLLLGLAVWGPPSIRGISISGMIGGCVFLVLGRYIFSPWIARRHYRNYKAIQEEFTIEILDDCVHISTADSGGKIKWANIHKWRHNDDYILIFPMPRIYYVVPKSLAASGFDIHLLLAKLTQNVGNPR
jgi:YcxB-like protein